VRLLLAPEGWYKPDMLALLAAAVLGLQPVDPSTYDCLRWRCIGPFRGGRTVGAAGIPEQPDTFFIGVNNGGVWKTTDAGRTWIPIFDDQPTGSIGAVAVAPSNPKVIYIGSGEGLQRPDLSTGDGIYRSNDGGKTWRHLGLRDGQQIASIIVDPNDPNRVFVAVLGHPYGANKERGVFRSTDGGASWEKVLYKGPDTGAVTLAFDPTDSRVLFADLWESRVAPWEHVSFQGPGSGLYTSSDGGSTWRQLEKGLPTPKEGLGRIGFDIARTDRKRMYALVDAPKVGGVFRSDDAGESWNRVSSEGRLWGRGNDFAEVRVDPTNADTVYIANTSSYRSVDGGRTWTCIKGSPGGDDYHTIWINPLHPDHILIAGDQGATISVNGGDTWSSWYNQPTAQFYHVVTDNQFPYWVYGGQQESGSCGVVSRGNDGQITFREWHPVGGDEYAYFAPDPLNASLVYGGKVARYHKDTGEVEQVGPDRKKLGLRYLRTSPLVFSPVDPKTLYLGAQVLLRTRDGATTWEVISPDLSRERPEVPECVGKYRTDEMAALPRRGVIYTVAPSCIDAGVIWCGTDDGLIHVTTDGGQHWRDVTPNGLTSWSKVSIIDAGRFDAKTAYAAVNRIRLDDQRPHIYRTHDGGSTWTEIVAGLPDGPVNAVREDPKRRGLLFCATETAVFFSLDDGGEWNPLRLNMPATSVRDVVVHEDDLVVGTHGRSFWILDNFSLLRWLPAKSDAPVLFEPPEAFEVARNNNTDTPLPPEEPAGRNPPDGAMLDYWLPASATKATLEIVDSGGAVVRRFSSDDRAPEVKPESLTVMEEWVRPEPVLSAAKGSHRLVWDLHLPRPRSKDRPEKEPEGAEEEEQGSLPISAIWHDTPFYPQGAWVQPGTYSVRLTVDGRVLEQHLEVKSDPRKH
jgi:photosystem II stability/assembly factor-like uncharacterized protein